MVNRNKSLGAFATLFAGPLVLLLTFCSSLSPEETILHKEPREQAKGFERLAAFRAVTTILKKQPGNKDAMLERARILKALHLDEAEDWAVILDLNLDTLQAAEVKQRLAELQTVKHPSSQKIRLSQIRSLAEGGGGEALAAAVTGFGFATSGELENWFRQWAALQIANKYEAAKQRLNALEHLAGALAESSGDQSYQKAAANIKNLEDPRSLTDLAQTIVSPNLDEKLPGHDHPLLISAKFDDLWDRLLEPEIGERLLQLARRASVAGCLHLQASSLWAAGLAQIRLGHSEAAYNIYREALPLFDRLADPDLLAGIHNLISESLNQLGQYREAWAHTEQALAFLGRAYKPYRRVQVNVVPGISALLQGYPELAHRFFKRACIAAREAGENRDFCEVSLWSCRALLALDRYEEARLALEKARSLLHEIQDPNDAQLLKAHIDLGEAEIALKSDPARSVGLIEQALISYHHKRYRIPEAHALYLLAQAHGLEGRPDRAEWALATCIDTYEAARAEIFDEDKRVSFLNRAEEAYDAMIDFQLAAGADSRAFDYAERKKARALLDRTFQAGMWRNDQQRSALESVTAPPRSQAEIRAALPRGTVVLSYTRLGNRLLGWRLDRDGIGAHTLSDRGDRVEELAGSFRAAVERGASDPAGKTLYATLITPMRVEDAQLLVVVPDGFLHGLPFAALPRPDSRYLIEVFPIEMAPSANVYLGCLERADTGPTLPPTVLAVGNPSFDPYLTPGLYDLPGAEREARLVADLYQGSPQPLLGDDATPARFLAEAGKHVVVHLATHALVDPPVLLFARDGNENGTLYASQLYGQPFEKTRLVVLASCRSASGSILRNEGVSGLARPFLAAGIPAVIGGLWAVPDGEGRDLLVAFHRYRQAGQTAAMALRGAQLDMIRKSEKNPTFATAWATFQLFGTLD